MIAYIHNTQELYLDLTKYYDLHVTMENVQYNTTIHTQYKQCIAFKIMYKFSIKSGFLSGYLNAQYG